MDKVAPTPQNMPRAPRFSPGERLGQLVVLRVIGHTYGHLDKKQWWYEVECDCGETEDICQDRLVAGRKTCWACRRGVSKQETDRAPNRLIDPGIPDFAKMKLG